MRLVIAMEDALTDPAYSAPARESIIDLLSRNVMHMDGGLPRGWSWRFVEDRGLDKLLQLACQIPEQCAYPVSAETRQHVSLCLSRLWDDMIFDENRDQFKDKCTQFFK